MWGVRLLRPRAGNVIDARFPGRSTEGVSGC